MTAASFAATITLTNAVTAPNVIPEQFVSASLAPAGNLSAPLFLIDTQSTAVLGPLGAITAAPVVLEQVVATMAPVGSLAADVIPEQFLSAGLAPAMAMSTPAILTHEQVAPIVMALAGAMSGDVVPEQFIAAALAVSASMVAPSIFTDELVVPSMMAISGAMVSAPVTLELIAASMALSGQMSADTPPEQFLSALFQIAVALNTPSLIEREKIIATLGPQFALTARLLGGTGGPVSGIVDNGFIANIGRLMSRQQ